MGFNYSKLLGRMKEFGFTQEMLSSKIDINKGTLNAKLHNKTAFTATEIADICKLLDIPKHEIGEYFFAKIVQNI